MILLTGASGYLGRHVADRLADRRVDFAMTSRSGAVGVACDLTDQKAVKKLFRKVQPETVIHCAANVPKTMDEYQDGAAAWASHLMTESLLPYSSLSGRVVFASSMTADYPTTAYSLGKRMSEAFCEWAFDYIILRLPGLFGAPRFSGSVYNSVRGGAGVWDSWPVMDVRDAAEYLVRAAVSRDSCVGPIDVGYTGPCAERYGSLGVTLQQRLEEFSAAVTREAERHVPSDFMKSYMGLEGPNPGAVLDDNEV